MKGDEEILPKTEITTQYDENGNLISEVTEDYDKNKISIKFPLKWLGGNTDTTDPTQLTQGDYTIEIYQTEDARDPVSKPVIKMKDDPFVLKFYHHDHLGTVRYITNESGEILHTTDTLAYGEELTAPYEDTNDKVLNTITYTGHEKDYETNLTYMMARYYSQGYGRFLSPDPGYDYDQLDPMSWNLYSYVRGNPVMRIDPDGKEAPTVENARKKTEKEAQQARNNIIENTKFHPETWSMEPDGKPTPELYDKKTVDEKKKETEGWKKADEKAEKETKIKRLNTVIEVADSVAKKSVEAGTISLASPVTAPASGACFTVATYASAVSVSASFWKANLSNSLEDSNNAKYKTIWFAVSIAATGLVNKLPLYKSTKNVINSFINTASTEVVPPENSLSNE